MPTYVYECAKCDEQFSLWQSIHDESHTIHADAEDTDCQAPIMRVITTVRTYGVGDRGKVTADTDARERLLVKDRDAYKRLRDDGHQPMQLRGAYELEARATSKFFIESRGLVDVPDSKVGEVEEAMAEARGSGWSPVEQVRAAKTRAGKQTDAPSGV